MEVKMKLHKVYGVWQVDSILPCIIAGQHYKIPKIITIIIKKESS